MADGTLEEYRQLERQVSQLESQLADPSIKDKSPIRVALQFLKVQLKDVESAAKQKQAEEVQLQQAAIKRR